MNQQSATLQTSEMHVSTLLATIRAENGAPPPRKAKSSSPQDARVGALDGLRGLAILLVLLFHFKPTVGILSVFDPVFNVGWIGVDLFFVLSGYLITGILLDSVGSKAYYRNFIVRRSLRIFPLYFACLALYCAFIYLKPSEWQEQMAWGSPWWFVFYLGNVKQALVGSWAPAAVLMPLWSLQVEEQYYLTFPFIVSKLNRKAFKTLLMASVVVAFALRVILPLIFPANAHAVYVLTPCRMDALALGGLVALYKREAPAKLNGYWPVWLTVVAAAGFVMVCIFFGTGQSSPMMRTVGYSLLDFACTGLLVMVIALRPKFLMALCQQKALVWLGTVSYGVYLLHIVAANATRYFAIRLLKITPEGTMDLLISLTVSLVAAWISWTVFESKVLKLKDRYTVR